MTVIGITGGIGSGKSVVSRLLETYGVPVYDADRESKRLTVSSPVIRERLTALLGADIYTPDGLNRALMAGRIFRDAALLERVNAIIHPEVSKDFNCWKAGLQTAVCALESAILFESGFNRKVDETLMVYAPEEVRIGRVMARDGMSEADVRQRMNRQWPDERKKALADKIILNDERTPLIPQIEALMAELG
ncbi:dephospho-CoA kinase [Tannerella sp.]|uniref:dephospho-CoA kinase n=1 Tax=Tannerella sp. TaxID=2382127 RepID=UPI0026DCE114|nr:dephospho-CoA kinase [Tannerella sp.]MDO4703236.1 dephospho-CoA kinase [Tannerella sp.]